MRKFILIFFLLVPSYLIIAQSEVDALRYSFTTHGGTARYMGMSGAFGALGADFSSLSTNPAGIGTFKKSRFMFSPIFMMNGVSADYRGENTINENVFVNMNNFGLILNLKPYEDDDSGWKSVAFGIGYNKLRSFNSDVTIKGYNENSSMLDQFMLNSDGFDPDNISEVNFHAYNTYLTDVIENSDNLYIHPYFDYYFVNQEKRITKKGGIGEYVFSLGGNYADVFQIGASFGIQNIRYKETSKYSEQSDSTDLNSFVFSENIETKGTGYNFKFGLIYRPTNFTRIGVAFHTPTFYKLKDIFSYSMESFWRTPDNDGNSDYYSETDGENEYTYELYTPMRVVTSAAFVIARYGIISADYEYVNYGRSRLRAEDYDFEVENETIKSSYNSGHNIRLGTELRLAPFFIRGGVSYYGSPHSKKFNAVGAVKGYSLGAGLKSQNVYIDIAFNHSFFDTDYQLYDYGDGTEVSKLSITEDFINFTLGYKF